MSEKIDKKRKNKLNNKKGYGKSVNKNTKIYIVVAILVLLLLQFIALGLSQARKVLEITVEVIDESSNILTQNIILNAVDTGDNIYSIILPEKINNIYVTEYHIKTETSTEVVTEEGSNSSIKVPGDSVYLTEEEINLLQTSLSVVYNSKEIGEGDTLKKLYYQDIYPLNYVEDENPENYLSNMYITGFMPFDFKFEVIEDQNIEVINLLRENISDEEQIVKNNKFEFKLNDEIYDISDLNENLIFSYFPNDIAKIYTVYAINKKTEYIGQKNVVDALGRPINTYNIEEIKEVSISNEQLNIGISDIEYLGITSRNNDFILMEKASRAGTKGMEVPSIFDSTTGTSLWDGSVSTSFIGNGTVVSPYLIRSGADLAYLRQQVNAGTDYENNYFQLVNNIDLDNREWEPIGSYTASFKGNFDGSGKKIQNGTVIASGTLSSTQVLSYGFFGSIGGGNARQIIQNLEFDNVKVEIRFYGSTTTSTTDRIFGVNVGLLAGTVFRNCTISNCNIKNMNIYEASGYYIYIRSYRFQYCVGGLVGEFIRLANSTGDPGPLSRYSIINCVISGELNINNTYAQNLSRSAQFAVGGIIGRIRSVPTIPENSLFRGNINAGYASIGPIFGQLRNYTNVTSTNNFDTLWQGNDAGNIVCTSKYNSAQLNGYIFTTTEISGTCSSNSRISTSSSSYGYTQGVNKGIYDNNNSQIMIDLNAAPEANNVTWTYDTTNGYSLMPRLRSTVIEDPEFTYSAYIDDLYNAVTYTYEWTLNNVVNSNTTSVYVLTDPNFGYDINVILKVKDNDGYYTIFEFLIPEIYVELTFDIDYNNNTAEGILSGPGMAFTSYDDYSFQWYTEDISGYEQTEVVGATDRFITDLNTMYDYKLVCTNNVISALSIEGSFSYATRTVIYVKENGGSNYNNGFTPETPVQDMPTAYSKLTTGGSRDENVIVVMDSISANDIFTGATNITYRKMLQ